VRLSLGLAAESNTYIGPANGAPITAGDIVIYVGGSDPDWSFLNAVLVSSQSAVFGNIYAPNGTSWLGDRTQATGAFLARNILIGKKVQVVLATSFSGLTRADGGPWAAEPGADNSAAEGVPQTYSLSQNFPNPFNPTTQIRYGLPRQSHVTLTVYNTLGQEIVRLADGVQEAGFHVLEWNGTNAQGRNVASGVYFYRLTAGKETITKRMVLLK